MSSIPDSLLCSPFSISIVAIATYVDKQSHAKTDEASKGGEQC